jgi:hypothetical protein
MEKEEAQLKKKGVSKRELKELRKEQLKKPIYSKRPEQKVQIINEDDVQEVEETPVTPVVSSTKKPSKKISESRLKAYGINPTN